MPSLRCLERRFSSARFPSRSPVSQNLPMPKGKEPPAEGKVRAVARAASADLVVVVVVAVAVAAEVAVEAVL